MDTTVLVPPWQLQAEFYSILLKNKIPKTKAKVCAEVFMANSLDGVYSHGVNRFSKFISFVQQGLVQPDHDPVSIAKIGAMEQWDGQSGIGITNGLACSDRSMEIASEHGIGCVALANTNHWMRAGTYGRHAASKGFALIAWTNTTGNTPAWGAVDPRLGNNPLVISVPYKDDAIVLDMAMSQFSYGALNIYNKKGEMLPVAGGYDAGGNLTHDPSAILESKRVLPIGYWKGSGLSLLLDILATIFSGGLSVSEISKQSEETKVSQVFISFNLKSLQHYSRISQLLHQIIKEFHESTPANENESVRYPGEAILKTRAKNFANGIPVLKGVWQEIQSLK